jgi:hypothetical protein
MRLRKSIGIALCLAFTFITQHRSVAQPQWPAITNETKPWTRWWWPGSIVTQQDLTAAMEKYNKAGLGGLELTVIYGVRGQENRFIPYLSPPWMEMFTHTLKEGQRLNLGIDLSNASSWPFGGSWVDTSDASKTVTYKTYRVKAGESIAEPIICKQQPLIRVNNYKKNIPSFTLLKEPIGKNPDLQEYAIDQIRFEKPMQLQTIMAYSDDGQSLDLTGKVDAAGKLNWVAPSGNWTLYAVFMGLHGKMVERAGPRGEGYVIDHFSDAAIHNFLGYFDNAFKGYDISTLRGYFNDSYEVDDAFGQGCWTPKIFEEFKTRRGYDLRNHLPAIFQKDTQDKNLRVLCDYRETVSDLLLEKFTKGWADWAHKQNKLVRNQAHGSPGNILDLYAASDIPETEGNDILRLKFGTSAANVSGKKLASAEVATWLGEHFLSTLNDVKKAVDRDFLAGVYHIVYHGTCFSPQNEPWPGFLFYAAVEFTPANSFWNDFPALNNYVSHVQSFMQLGKPNNDVLLYFPIYDSYSDSPRYMLEHFDGFKNKDENPSFRKCAEAIRSAGSSFDYVSDLQLKNISNSENLLQSAGASYKAIVLPPCKYMPLETFEKIVSLVRQGATVIVNDSLPYDVPGWGNLTERQKAFRDHKKEIVFVPTENIDVKEAKLGKGRLLSGKDLNQLLAYANITEEPMVSNGLEFIRRTNGDETIYFVVNQTEKLFEGWLPLSTKAKTIAIYNPMTGIKGLAKTRPSANDKTEIYTQILPGESFILQTSEKQITGRLYPFFKPNGTPHEVDGKWTVTFVEGGPSLPHPAETKKLTSWTEFGGDEVKNFSGTAVYTIHFSKPIEKTNAWLLELGDVHESARVFLNGKELSTLISPPFQVIIDNSLLKNINTLEIKVSNLMANRIADLDRRDVNWKKFYNTNFAARLPENRKDGLFNASKWPAKESGLMGPVKIQAIKIAD